MDYSGLLRGENFIINKQNIKAMDIVNIETSTFEAMLSKFEGFAKKIEHLCRLRGEKNISGWLKYLREQ